MKPVSLVITIALSIQTARAASCENLTSLKLSDATITLAQSVAAGAFTPPAGQAHAVREARLGPIEICRRFAG